VPERGRKALSSFGDVAAHQPETEQRRAHPQPRLVFVRNGLAPLQGRPQIVMLRLQTVQPLPLLRTAKMGPRLFGQAQKEPPVPPATGLALITFHQPVAGVLADGFEQAVAALPLFVLLIGDERLFHQSGQQVEHLPAFDGGHAAPSSAAVPPSVSSRA
jgi:hypothetical protein